MLVPAQLVPSRGLLRRALVRPKTGHRADAVSNPWHHQVLSLGFAWWSTRTYHCNRVVRHGFVVGAWVPLVTGQALTRLFHDIGNIAVKP